LGGGDEGEIRLIILSAEFLNILNPLDSVGDSACGLAHTNTNSFFKMPYLTAFLSVRT